MTRRMQANPDHSPDAHGAEHDEDEWCEMGIPCEPVPAEPGVLVPATGTVLVVDGVVQDVYPADVITHRCGVGCSAAHHGPGTVTYTIAVRPPKPAFFEPGKKYRRFVDWSIRAQAAEVTERFECTVVEKDGDGNPVAFGRLTVPCTTGKTNGVDTWTLMGGYQWKNDGWAEA
ncbi:hypothetical protein [Streptomyces roseolus]|uniref:hypothetical protein n=1 Tax=Streptomyces roseolus TaxID=67358 RepID=UPI001676CF5D|nr:hypothetical protein [Streptomyces roseolus]GGR51656.1 hypothetical protein GCM10010282_50730 [Streptomyces roseolus]